MKLYLNLRILVKSPAMVVRLTVWWHTHASLHSNCVVHLHERAEQQENGMERRQDAVSIFVVLRRYFNFEWIERWHINYEFPRIFVPEIPSLLRTFVPSFLHKLALSFRNRVQGPRTNFIRKQTSRGPTSREVYSVLVFWTLQPNRIS